MEKINFKPFDKVLGRADSGDHWCCDFYSYYDYDTSSGYPFVCVGNFFSQCIPFEGNEHLLGTTDDYEEPYVPKDGDFVVMYEECIAICKKPQIDELYGGYKFNVYAYSRLSYDDIFYFHMPCTKQEDIRSATDEEKETFLSKLAEIGKKWDAEKKEIVEYRWKPKHGENYWFVNTVGEAKVVENLDIENRDVNRIKLGNCFRTEAEAQVMADKFKELLKGGNE